MKSLTKFLISIFLISSTSCEKQPELISVPINTPTQNKIYEELVIHQKNIFFEYNNFHAAIKYSNSINTENENIQAIIVPHHLLAASIIATQIAKTQNQKIKQIFLIGPNHEEFGYDSLYTAIAKWELNNKTISTNNKTTKKLITELNIKNQPQYFKNEHSIGAILPFIEYYHPNSAITPIIVSSKLCPLDRKNLVEFLNTNCNQNCLIIGSIDFSHFLNYQEASDNDHKTKKLILKNDIETLLTLSNQYVDSPQTLAIILEYATRKNITPKIDFHHNALDFSYNNPQQTTSYFGISF